MSTEVGVENSRRVARSGPVPTGRCRVERHSDFSNKLLFAESGAIYELVRTLRPTLTGKVKFACAVNRRPDGSLHHDPSAKFAIKVYHKTCVETRTNIHHARILEDPREEWRLWHHLSSPGHPNVAKMFQLLEDDTKFYCVMEYIEGGELFDRMASGAMSRVEAREAAFGVVSAVRYLHERGVCHRDLSLENFMLCKDGTVKVIDFGQSRPWVLSPFAPVTVGKKGTRAPEVYKRLPHDGRAVDMWAIGSVIFTILTTLPPYETVGDSFYNYLVRQGARNLLTHWDLAKTMDPHALELVHNLLCPDVAKRLSAEDAYNSPWFAAERKAAEAEAAARVRDAMVGEVKSPEKADGSAPSPSRDTVAAPGPLAASAPPTPVITASPSMEEMDGVVPAGGGSPGCSGGGGGGCGEECSVVGCDTPTEDAGLLESSCGASSMDNSFVSTGKARSDSSFDYAPSVRSVSVESCESVGECSASYDVGSPEPALRQHSAGSTAASTAGSTVHTRAEGMEVDQPSEQPQASANAKHLQNPTSVKVREESCVSLMSVGEAQKSPLTDTTKAQAEVATAGFVR